MKYTKHKFDVGDITTCFSCETRLIKNVLVINHTVNKDLYLVRLNNKLQIAGAMDKNKPSNKKGHKLYIVLSIDYSDNKPIWEH